MSEPDLSYEKQYWQQGLCRVAGVDEAGRGPLAGPVVAAAVILPRDCQRLKGLTDSKQLTSSQRDHYYLLIQEVAVDYSVGVITVPVIDKVNILQATWRAMRKALAGLSDVEGILVDGNRSIPDWPTPQQALVKGDGRSLSIAAASVLAKVVRDRIMEALDTHYPAYGFARHKGYPTRFHREQIRQLGLSPQHRKTFCGKLLV